MELGQFYLNVTEELKKAEYYLLKGTELDDGKDVYISLSKNYSFYELYKKMGLYKKALSNYEKYSILQDSISSLDIKKDMNRLEVKYETSRKEYKIESLAKENEIQALELKNGRYILIGVSSIFLLIIAITFLLLRSKKEQIKKRLVEIELYFLQRQMNPHFISNALTAIQNKVLDKKMEITHKYLSQFSLLVRNILICSRTEQVQLKDELKTIESYLALEVFRTENLFSYSIEVDKDIDVNSVTLPTMLLQPLVENAIVHGILAKDVKDGYIRFEVKKELGYAVFEIEDNGVGIEASQKKEKKEENDFSISTSILKERISLLNRKVSEKIKFEIIDRKKLQEELVGTIARVYIPHSFS